MCLNTVFVTSGVSAKILLTWCSNNYSCILSFLWFPGVWIYVLMFWNTVSSIFDHLWRWNWQSFLKCWLIIFIHWGITQKKEYSIQKMVKLLKSRIIILAFAETQVPPSAFNGSLSAGTTVTREEQERLSTPLHVHVDPVSFLHMNY